MIDNSLSNYISQLQLLAFFAGYPLIYTLVNFLATERLKEKPLLSKKWIALLPFAYALVGTLFIGLLLKNISPDFSVKNIAEQFSTPYLEVWGTLAVLFWIPALSKKPVFSLLHSLPFFFILLKDFMQISISERFVIENDMKMYTISLLLNTGALVVMYAISYGLHHFRIRRNTAH
jgi:hypothetical protein